jgi:hypothetical protein
MVELEQHSFCNRKCWFCPNSFIDRQFKPVAFLDEGVYIQILKDLASINYSQIISFSGNCEPFSQPQFYLERVKWAREHLPNAFLMSNSNTDYLTAHIVRTAAAHGLNVLKAQLYFGKNEEYTDEAIKEKFGVLQEKLSGITFSQMLKNQWFTKIGDCVVHAYSKDWHKVGHNRCDVPVRKTVKRMHTCYEPVQYIGVNYNGWVTPCCNLRSDYERHEPLMLGQMDETPGRIFELYQGLVLSEKEYPCVSCMAKEWHANGKLTYETILEEWKNGE